MVEQEQRPSGQQVAVAEVDDKTMPYLGEMDGIDPVTGWLVCIEGPQMGRDYRILSEKTLLVEQRICTFALLEIIRFLSVTMQSLFMILKRNFYLLPGDASGLAYLNNEAVYTPTELAAYDVIQLGRSMFLFIPLCGVHFEWENNNSEE